MLGGPTTAQPPWAFLRAWARALLSAPMGPLKSLGPRPFKGSPGPS